MGPVQKIAPPGPLWPMDLKLTHLNWSPEATLIHVQGQLLTVCDLDYTVLQEEIQKFPKTQRSFEIGETCLVEDVLSARWYRGRVQSLKEDLYDVYLIDYGNILTVDEAHVSSCSTELFTLPPKLVCGFLSNVLLLPGCFHSVMDQYLSSQIGRHVTCYVQAILPHQVVLVEAPDINNDLIRHGFGKHVNIDTFLLLVEMLIDAPLKQKTEPAPDLLEKHKGHQFTSKPTSLQDYEEITAFIKPELKCWSRASVFVTAAVRPDLFYCQMADKAAELKELSNKLTAICEVMGNTNQQMTPDKLGLLCSVKGKDDKWYRGFIQNISFNSTVRVLFFDYGFCETVEIENVHMLPPDFSVTPIMAFPCALSGLNNEDEALKAQQLGFLKTGLLGGQLEIEIKKQERNLCHIAILDAQESVLPAPIQNVTRTDDICEPEKLILPQHLPGHLCHETIMSKELDKTLEDEKVQVGSVFVGFMEFTQNPNHFWIRTEKRNEEFEEMMETLSKHFRDLNLEEDVLERPEPGMLCCAVYEEDMHFYRSVVIEPLEHGAEVLFIDFGNTGEVPHNLIKKIPAELSAKPAFALCCSLVNVAPYDDFWTITSTDFFRRLVSGKELHIRVLQRRKNKLDVDVCVMEDGTVSGQSVSDLLISNNQAQHGKNVFGKSVKTRRQFNPVTMEIVKKTNQLLLNTSECKDGIDKSSSKVQIVNLYAPVSLKPLKLKPGSKFSVFCQLIITPSDFWCQCRHTMPELEALMMKLQGHYSAQYVPLEPGAQCCIVKLTDDSRWCRGIIENRQNGRAKVILADFGSSVTVREECLQGLLPQHCALERQAFRCSLHDVIGPPALGWSAAASECLRRFVKASGSSLKCEVICQFDHQNKGSCNAVQLFNAESNTSASDFLLQHDQSHRVTSPPFPAVLLQSYVFSSFDLHAGSEEPVYVTHVNSQFEVLCQLEKNTAILEKLEAKISEVDKVERVSGEGAEQLCLAKYLDGKWYRGVASSTLLPSHYCVTFVDYGNTMMAEKNQVSVLPRDCTELLWTPMQALKFTLTGVQRDLAFADVKDWLDGAVLNKLVRAVIGAKEEDGSFQVELFDGEVSINEKLKELIQIHAPKPKIATTFMRMGKRIHEREKVTCNYKHKAKSSAISNLQHKTNKNKSEMNYQQNRAGTVRSRPVRMNRGKTTTDQAHREASRDKVQGAPTVQVKAETEIFQPKHTAIFNVSCLPALKLTEGSKLRCFVSHVNSLSSFYLQRSDDTANFHKMVDDLNSRAFRDTLKPASGTTLKPDDLVLAEYEEDGALYRAAVKEIDGHCALKVEFVDFGNTALMGKEKMYLLTKDYITQPRYSILCKLRDPSAFNNSLAFTDAVIDKPLTVDFISCTKSQWEVNIEVMGATAAVQLETVASKKTAFLKKNSTAPRGKRLTQTKGKTGRKKSTTVDMSQDLISVFKPLTIQRGDVHTVYVLSVQTFGDFYVRLVKSVDCLKALETFIAVNMKNCSLIPEKHVKVGLTCLAQDLKAGTWHRAVVHEMANTACRVFLCDHGKTESVAKSSLREMSGRLEKISPFAVCCRLNLSRGSQQSSQMCSKAMNAVDQNKAKFVFVGLCKKENVWFVEMVMDESFILQRALNTETQIQQDFATAHNTSPPADAPQKLSFAPVELDKEYFGVAAAVASPYEFCVVLEDLHLMSQVYVCLEDITDELELLPSAHLIPGTGCLVKSKLRDKWCRAEILHADSALTLNLVDYGHHEHLSHKDLPKLRKLSKCVLELPKVTYPCTLRAVRPAGAEGLWTNEAAIFFQQCLDQRNLQIFFREKVLECQWKVDVLVDGVHLAKQLVEAGHAACTDVMLELRLQLSHVHVQRPGADEECDEDAEQESSLKKLSRFSKQTLSDVTDALVTCSDHRSSVDLE